MVKEGFLAESEAKATALTETTDRQLRLKAIMATEEARRKDLAEVKELLRQTEEQFAVAHLAMGELFRFAPNVFTGVAGVASQRWDGLEQTLQCGEVDMAAVLSRVELVLAQPLSGSASDAECS